MIQKSSPSFPAPEIPYPSLVGQVIKQARLAKGIQQSELAEILGLSQSAYSRLESGDSVMNVWQLRQLALTVGTTPSALLAEVERPEAQLAAGGRRIVPRNK